MDNTLFILHDHSLPCSYFIIIPCLVHTSWSLPCLVHTSWSLPCLVHTSWSLPYLVETSWSLPYLVHTSWFLPSPYCLINHSFSMLIEGGIEGRDVVAASLLLVRSQPLIPFRQETVHIYITEDEVANLYWYFILAKELLLNKKKISNNQVILFWGVHSNMKCH